MSARVVRGGGRGVLVTELGHLATIRRYYDGRNRGDVELMMSTLDPDVVHYFVIDPPVRAAKALALKWVPFNQEGRVARWSVDHGVEQGDEAVVEWTLLYTQPDRIPSTVVTRGAEWYVFRRGRIFEIRSYELTGERRGELNQYPYVTRGYPNP
jgi:SnoaL-like domain